VCEIHVSIPCSLFQGESSGASSQSSSSGSQPSTSTGTAAAAKAKQGMIDSPVAFHYQIGLEPAR